MNAAASTVLILFEYKELQNQIIINPITFRLDDHVDSAIVFGTMQMLTKVFESHESSMQLKL